MCFWENLKKEANKATLESIDLLKTRQLLSKLQITRAAMSQISFRFNDSEPNDSTWVELKRYKTLLKQVLSTREHVPNKAEAKAIRQEKARRKT